MSDKDQDFIYYIIPYRKYIKMHCKDGIVRRFDILVEYEILY